jgi:Na+/H+ antiporter NhaD/arsenite permease-like protein
MIRDWPLFVSSSVLLGGVVVLFFLHSFVDIHLNLAWIACIGAMLHMVISGVKDIEQVIEHVEWSTLMFFAALFILMRALDRLGLIQYFGLQVAYWISQVPESGQLAAAVTIVVWISGIGSAFVDNIPITGALIPVVVQLSSAPLNLPVGPLVWALAFGACLGGNGTLVGASANVVAAGLLESAGHPLTFNRFFAKGAPIALISLAVANVYLLVFHVAIPWY